MIYNRDNEVDCDYECEQCKMRNVCADAFVKKEKEDKEKDE